MTKAETSVEPARRITLMGREVEFRLIRARRGSIAMQIRHDGLTVRAPKWVPLREVVQALEQRANWIVGKLAEWSRPALRPLPERWQTGETLLYRGRELSLALFACRRKAVAADLLKIQVLHPTPDNAAEISAFVLRWLREQALCALAPRVAHYAARITAITPRVALSDARTQWGSCNRHGEIRLHWRLIQMQPDLADYVVAHEVAHLVELNHSRRFWSLLESIYPHYRTARRQLDALVPLLCD